MYSHYDTNMSKERGNPMRRALEEKGKKRKRASEYKKKSPCASCQAPRHIMPPVQRTTPWKLSYELVSAFNNWLLFNLAYSQLLSPWSSTALIVMVRGLYCIYLLNSPMTCRCLIRSQRTATTGEVVAAGWECTTRMYVHTIKLMLGKLAGFV